MRYSLLLLLAFLAAPTFAQADESEDYIANAQASIKALDAEIQHLQTPAVPGWQQDKERLWKLADKLHQRAKQHYYLAAERGAQAGTEYWDDPSYKRDLRASLEACTKLLALSPGAESKAQATLFMAQVHRELGEYEQVLIHLQQLTENHASTPQAAQALMQLGDYYFDRSELDAAAKYYVRLVKRPDKVCEAMARYKLGWVAINREHWKKAAILFERIALGPEETPCFDIFDNQPAKIELVPEALAALTFCFTHVHPPTHALEYFGRFKMAPKRAVHIYEKLANRLYILQEFPAARLVYRHLLTLPADPEWVEEWKQRLADLERLGPTK